MTERAIDGVLSSLGPLTPVAGESVSWRLEDRMAHYGVPGVSIAVIDQGEIAWSIGCGHLDAARSGRVDAGTVFQAASMSKPVAALAMLREVEAGVFDLDAPINEYLSSWQVPENELTRRAAVTLRRILSHTAGLTVWGFGGYAEGEPLPTLPQVLSGLPPANSPPVFVDVLPGTIERYSGGGTTIAQLALQEHYDRPYAEILAERILEPLGMRDSTFAQPLPGAFVPRAAAGHHWGGATVAGRWHTYPEQAAAGLWTTSGDYARFLVGLQSAFLGRAGSLITRETCGQLATIPPGGRSFGLGPKIIGQGRARRFQHGGSNAGYICGSNAFLDGSRGVVVLTNSDSGAGLAEEIILAVARVYQWPDYARAPRVRRRLSADEAARYAGRYAMAAGSPYPMLEIRADGGELIYQLGTMAPRPVYAETAVRFFSPESLYDTEFSLDGRGHATAISVLDGDRVILSGTRME